MKTKLLILTFLGFGFSAPCAELFIRVNMPGIHYAIVGNQTIYNNTNNFRFFDLAEGAINVQIVNQQTGVFIFNSALFLIANQQIVGEIGANGQFTVIQNKTINQENWYTSVYSDAPSSSTQNVLLQNEAPTDESFQQFLKFLDEEFFDSKKLTKAQKYADKTTLSIEQIVAISKKFSFDTNRLEWAKYAYTNCADKANYFLLKSTFSFSTNYAELEKYIESL